MLFQLHRGFKKGKRGWGALTDKEMKTNSIIGPQRRLSTKYKRWGMKKIRQD